MENTDFWAWIKKMVTASFPILPNNVSSSVWNPYHNMRTPSGVIDWKIARDPDGLSMLHTAAIDGQIQCVQLALTYGVDINAKTKDGSTALHYQVQRPDFYYNDAYREIFKLLIYNGADVNVKNAVGNNVLFQAVQEGRSMEQLEPLLRYGANWKKLINKSGFSILHVAAIVKNLEALRYFLSEGANVNFQDFNGYSPLHHAAVHAEGAELFEMLAMLLDKGADVSAVDLEGNNALLAAAFNSAPKKTKTELELLVVIGCDYKLVNKAGRNILHLVAEGGDMNVLNYCLRNLMADVHKRDVELRTPLLYMATMDASQPFLGNVTLLLEAGADINVVDIDGKRFLDLAKESGKTASQLSQLVQFGAK